MKSIFILMFVLITSVINSQNLEVQKTIEIFFEGFHQRDSIKMKTTCSKELQMQSISKKDNVATLVSENPTKFFKSIVSIPNNLQFEERILSYNIQIDGDMAHVWTPYEFYLNGKLSHRGVNAFTLFKENAIWKIIYLIDTRRK